jgi:ribokinase
MRGFDVVGFGALNVDEIFKVARIVSAEEESAILDHIESCGGSAANTIVGLARLGCKTGFIGKVAGDREGEMLLESLRQEGVDVNGIAVSKQGRSGRVMGFVDGKGERALYVDAGVNDTIEYDKINSQYAFGTKILHLTSFVGKKSFQTQKKLVEKLPRNVKISFDPGALYAKIGLAKLEPMIKRTFALLPSASELEALTGTSDYETGAQALFERGVKLVAVKLGADGCYVTDGTRKRLIEAFKVKIVDTTGAGDAFCAGFLYGLISGQSLFSCGRIGNFVASRCITKLGARAGLPIRENLEEYKLI